MLVGKLTPNLTLYSDIGGVCHEWRKFNLNNMYKIRNHFII